MINPMYCPLDFLHMTKWSVKDTHAGLHQSRVIAGDLINSGGEKFKYWSRNVHSGHVLSYKY